MCPSSLTFTLGPPVAVVQSLLTEAYCSGNGPASVGTSTVGMERVYNGRTFSMTRGEPGSFTLPRYPSVCTWRPYGGSRIHGLRAHRAGHAGRALSAQLLAACLASRRSGARTRGAGSHDERGFHPVSG